MMNPEWTDMILTKDKEGNFRVYETLDEARKDRELLPTPIPYERVKIGFEDGDWVMLIGYQRVKLTDLVHTTTE